MSEVLSLLPGVSFVDSVAHIDGVPVPLLAKNFGTPLYAYSKAVLKVAIDDWKVALNTQDRVFFAVKANSTRGILREMVNAGLGFDIVSGGELARVLAAGATPDSIVYSGVGKTVSEITSALKANILCFNVESESELFRISNIASELNCVANVSLRINPDVDPKTHPYISTGLKNNKFGIDYSDAVRLFTLAKSLPGINITGISSHIGSQLTELSPYLDAADRILDLVEKLNATGINLSHIDCGGGLGVCYTDEKPPQAKVLISALHDKLKSRGYSDMSLYFEPGRHLVAKCGYLITEVQYLKPTPAKNFCIVDAAMSDMIRPSLYQAVMPLFNAYERNDTPLVWEIVGPVCESGDWLFHNAKLAVRAGDVLLMPSAGAYGSTMSSNYNSRPKAAEVMIENGEVTLLRERENVDDLMRLEK